jgi:uncharacterized membrane protein
MDEGEAVNTITVWRFETPQAAGQAIPGLERLAAAGEVHVDDAALAAWPLGCRKPSTSALGSLTGPGRLWGGFWGVLLALIFLTRLAGPVFGAGAAAVAGSLSEFGVADDFVARVRRHIVPGTSALFVVSTRASAERLATELQGVATPIATSALSPAEEQHLLEALGEESASPGY